MLSNLSFFCFLLRSLVNCISNLNFKESEMGSFNAYWYLHIWHNDYCKPHKQVGICVVKWFD